MINVKFNGRYVVAVRTYLLFFDMVVHVCRKEITTLPMIKASNVIVETCSARSRKAWYTRGAKDAVEVC